ncbi:hypothetical protein Tco_1262944 [Tanacetum coccineum]
MKVTVTTQNGRELIKGQLDLNTNVSFHFALVAVFLRWMGFGFENDSFGFIAVAVADLQNAIHQKIKKYYPSRQLLTLPHPSQSKGNPIVLQYKKCLTDYTNVNSDTITIIF